MNIFKRLFKRNKKSSSLYWAEREVELAIEREHEVERKDAEEHGKKYGSQLASMASNSVGEQLIERLKDVDKPCEVRAVISVSLDFSTRPEGIVFKETCK